MNHELAARGIRRWARMAAYHSVVVFRGLLDSRGKDAHRALTF